MDALNAIEILRKEFDCLRLSCPPVKTCGECEHCVSEREYEEALECAISALRESRKGQTDEQRA